MAIKGPKRGEVTHLVIRPRRRISKTPGASPPAGVGARDWPDGDRGPLSKSASPDGNGEEVVASAEVPGAAAGPVGSTPNSVLRGGGCRARRMRDRDGQIRAPGPRTLEAATWTPYQPPSPGSLMTPAKLIEGFPSPGSKACLPQACQTQPGPHGYLGRVGTGRRSSVRARSRLQSRREVRRGWRSPRECPLLGSDDPHPGAPGRASQQTPRPGGPGTGHVGLGQRRHPGALLGSR